MSGCKICGRIINFGAKAIAFWGAAIHIICIALMYVCRMERENLAYGVPQNITDFMLWLVMPVSVVFMAAYTAMAVAMVIPVVKGRTVFPRWAAVFNPLFLMIVINAAAFAAPNTAFVNAVRMSNMGIGSLVTFTGLLLLLRRSCSRQQ